MCSIDEVIQELKIFDKEIQKYHQLVQEKYDSLIQLKNVKDIQNLTINLKLFIVV